MGERKGLDGGSGEGARGFKWSKEGGHGKDLWDGNDPENRLEGIGLAWSKLWEIRFVFDR